MTKVHVVWFGVIALAIVFGGWMLYSLIANSKRELADESSQQNALAFENRPRIGFNCAPSLPAVIPA